MTTATETKTMRPKPRPGYKGAIAVPDADEKVASAALMMLGCDKGEVATSSTDVEDSEEDLDDEDEEDRVDKEVGVFDSPKILSEVEGEKLDNDEDTSSEYISSCSNSEWILTGSQSQLQLCLHPVLKPNQSLILNLKCLVA